MANPNAVVPYHDPYDDQISIIHQTLIPDEDPGIRAIADIPCMAEPNANNPLLPQCDGGIADANDPLMDPFIWDLCNNSLLRVDVSEAGSAEIRGETDGQAGLNCDPQTNSNHGNPLRVSTWPLPEVPYSCSCCLVLREITHTNGTHIAKLEIHGRLGLICHAIFEKYDIGVTSQDHEYQMFDFRQESTRNVKQFLVQYCAERKQAGYIMLQDPLLIFYEALCVGCNSEDNMAIDDFLRSSPVDSGACQRNQLEAMSTEPESVTQHEAEHVTTRSTRSSLAAQRERTGKLTLKDFIQYFHLPIENAARKMSICPTVMKKICRRHGLPRWPHRKIKSIEKKISRKTKSLSTGSAEERAVLVADINRLQQELENIFAQFRNC